MSKLIDFTLFEKKVTPELAEEIKKDIFSNPYMNEIVDFTVKDVGTFIVIAYRTRCLIKLYTFDVRLETYDVCTLSTTHYDLIKELMEGGN